MYQNLIFFFLSIHNFSSNTSNVQRDRIFSEPIIIDTLNQIEPTQFLSRAHSREIRFTRIRIYFQIR